jgi:hypothetical protein
MAALGNELLLYALPSIFGEASKWPLVHACLKKWKKEVSENPYFPKQVSIYPPETINAILQLELENPKDFLDRMFVIITCFTSMRTVDAYNIFNKNISKLPMSFKQGATIVDKGAGAYTTSIDDIVPRALNFLLNTIKNDRTGQGNKSH